MMNDVSSSKRGFLGVAVFLKVSVLKCLEFDRSNLSQT